MLRYLAIFAVIFGLAVFVARQDEHTAKDSAQKAAHLNAGAIPAKTDENHPQENVPEAEQHGPSWYGFFRWPNGTTTWAIILTLMAIAEQTKETAKAAKAAQESAKATQDSIPHQEKAAEAAKLSAEAALSNAQAVINSERPWLFIKTSDPVPLPRTSYVTFTIVNRGRTPAEIIAHHVDRFFGIPDNLPPVPKYPLAGYELSHKRYLAPEDTFSLDSLNSGDFSDDAWEEANIPNAYGRYKWLVFQGHVVYRDLITREQHETRFCYFLSPSPWVGLVLCGPPGYNQHT